MHIVAILLFLATLSLAIGVIFASLADYKDKIIDALLGRNLGSHGGVVLVSNQSSEARAVGMSAAANEDFSLPLAA